MFPGLAQERPIKNPAGPLPVKTDTIPAPSVRNELSTITDSVRITADSIPPPKGDIETTINYSATDSIRASIDGKIIWLYGAAKITYGQIELEAEEVIIDYANHTITAQGVKDSLGNRIGYPIFKDGNETYETKGIIYNFDTKRARIMEVVTKQGDGFLHADAAFKNENNEILSVRNSYTTCDLEHPHYRIRSTKTKAIPDDKIVSGPFYFEFNDIPLPLGFLFGMFPAQRESKSGILFPSYGEQRSRGFNLTGGGYFFDINEYLKLALTGDIYSKGGHAFHVMLPYMKKYSYNGNLNFNYSKTPQSENIENRNFQNDFSLSWSHSPQSKGSGRFAASVNAASSTYTRNNNLMYGIPGELSATGGISQVAARLNSNVSYSTRFKNTPFSAGFNVSHTQNLQTRVVDLQLPSLTVNMTNIYPFQRKGVISPLDNFSIGYNLSASNRVTNNLGRVNPESNRDSIAPFTFDNLALFLQNARRGIRHSLPITYSFKALKHFTVSPSVNYTERWYFERFNWKWNSDSTQFVSETDKTFNRVANYDFSVSANTRIFGMYVMKNKNSRVKAIRHVVNPNVGFSYTPDFSKNQNYFDTLRNQYNQLIYRSKHEGLVNGGSALGNAALITFGIGNNVEMKVKSKKDTVERKVMLLNNLSINSSYNVIADSFNLAPIAFSANSNILNNLININLSGSLDPYSTETVTDRETGNQIERRYNTLKWNSGQLGTIRNATLALSTNLSPKGRDREAETREKVSNADIPEHEKQYILQNPNVYVDFDIPWSLNISYTLSYSNQVNQRSSVTQTLNFNGDLSLSEKWKVTYNSGYHFETKTITTTNFGISRDVHCWTMNLTWVPFGPLQSYSFTIAVKSQMLKDLKLERRRPFLDNRFVGGGFSRGAR